MVEINEIIIARIIGPFKKDMTKATIIPTSPAYQDRPKSVSARGNINAPSAARGSNIMHFRMNLGSFDSADEAKYGIILGKRVTRAHETIMANLFNSNLLI